MLLNAILRSLRRSSYVTTVTVALCKLNINHLVKILCNKFGRKTRLKPLYDELEILNINGIYKLEIAKFMAKVSSNTLSEDFSKNFSALTSVHTYSTHSALFKKFYVQRTTYIKTNRSLKVSGVKVWNGIPSLSEIKQLLPAAKPFQKYSKNTFYYGHNSFR